MGAQLHDPNFEILRSNGRAGNAAPRAPMGGCLGGLRIRDLSSRGMAGAAAADSCALLSGESAGGGRDFPATRTQWDAVAPGASFLNRFLGGLSHLPDVSRAQGRSR